MSFLNFEGNQYPTGTIGDDKRQKNREKIAYSERIKLKVQVIDQCDNYFQNLSEFKIASRSNPLRTKNA